MTPTPSRSLRHQAGFTMIAAMGALMVVMSLSLAAFAAAGGDIPQAQRDVDAKKALGAAESGLAYYLQKLSQDNDYWTKCTNGPSADETNPVNQPWYGAPGSADPRKWKSLPGDATTRYAVELLARKTTAQPTNPVCQTTANESMLDPNEGTVRIRSTGEAGPATRRVRRSVVATLRRKGFLDFLYFTNFETSDPSQQTLDDVNALWMIEPTAIKRGPVTWGPDTGKPNDSIAAWAGSPEGCTQWYRQRGQQNAGVALPGRAATTYPGSGFFDADADGAEPKQWNLTSRSGGYNIRCSSIIFNGGEETLAGPFHTNDSVLACNSFKFGRDNKGDRIEYWDNRTDGCGNAPTFGTGAVVRTGDAAGILNLPRSNGALLTTTFTPYIFEGSTTINISGDRMTGTRASGATFDLPLPPNGLIYVKSSTTVACGPQSDVRFPEAPAPGCGDVRVKGTYAKSLTIGAERDIVVTGDLKATAGSDALLGLIGTGLVRVEHKVASYPCWAATDDVPANTQQPRTIEAAILSLNRVFTVDSYHCGERLGNLRVKGAIAQNFRGPVGKPGTSGYAKQYEYDSRLKYRSPPYFLPPVDSAWRILRTSEQSPAR